MDADKLVVLEADNTTMIAMLEKDLVVMLRAASLITRLSCSGGPVDATAKEAVGKLNSRASSTRDFLDKLYNAGCYPQQ